MNIEKLEKCRMCGGEIKLVYDFGEIYISGFVKPGEDAPKAPMSVVECKNCGLVQLGETVDLDFLYKKQYWYMSALNKSMLASLKDIVDKTLEKIELKPGDVVVDIGCFVGGTKILMGDFTTESIENISVGDRVFTASNNVKKVLSTFTRNYSDTLYKIKTTYGYNVTCTKEHPILGVKKSLSKLEENLKFIPANELLVGDFVAIPRVNIETWKYSIDSSFEDLYTLYGWYLAEGNVIYSHKPKVCGIALTLNINETEHVKCLEEISNRLGYNITKSIRPDKSTIDLRIYSKQLAEEVLRLFGKGAKDKFIHTEIFTSNNSLKLLLLKALFRGDGHIRTVQGGIGMQYELSSRSNTLLWGVQTLLKQLGVCSYRYDYKGEPWYITLGGNSINLLEENTVTYSGKQHFIKTDNYLLVRIKSIETEETTCPVYNLEVEDDNSYIANGVGVHNCNDASLFNYYPDDTIRVGYEPASNIHETANGRCNYFIGDYFTGDAYPKFLPKAKVVTSIAMFYDLPDPNKFVEDVKAILDTDGIWVIQLTDLTSILQMNEVTSVGHEHLEMYKLQDLAELMNKHHLDIFDLEYNKTNGRSLRLYVCYQDQYPVTKNVGDALYDEDVFYEMNPTALEDLFTKTVEVGNKVKKYLEACKDAGIDVYGIGASTKGNTMLQYFGIDNTLLKAIGEVNPDKFNLVTAGTNIPIISEKELFELKPQVVLLIIWQFTDTMLEKLKPHIEKDDLLVLVPLPEPFVSGYSGGYFL